MFQVTARLSTEIRAEFDAYAASVGLDASELARLLITRELRKRRILPASKRNPISRGKAPARKLTAHFHGSDIIADLDAYSTDNGYNRSEAAALIFERELTEKWLLSAFSWSPPKDLSHPE
jgi:hypothetical protein